MSTYSIKQNKFTLNQILNEIIEHSEQPLSISDQGVVWVVMSEDSEEKLNWITLDEENEGRMVVEKRKGDAWRNHSLKLWKFSASSVGIKDVGSRDHGETSLMGDGGPSTICALDASRAVTIFVLLQFSPPLS